jgi:hypothetical protein
MTVWIVSAKHESGVEHFFFSLLPAFDDFMTGDEADKSGLCEGCPWASHIHPGRSKLTARGEVWEKLCTRKLRKKFPAKIEMIDYDKRPRKGVIYV